MKTKNVLIVAGAAVAVYLLLRTIGSASKPQPKYWATAQGNTGFPDDARTGSGKVWI